MSGQHEIPGTPSDGISSLKFSASSTRLAVSSWDCTVSIYQQDNHTDAPFVRETIVQCRAPILDVCWGADEESLYAVGLDQDVRALRIGSQEQTVLSTHNVPSNKVAYSRDHNIVLSTSWDGFMHVHSPETMCFIRVRLAAKPFAIALTAERAVVAMAQRKTFIYDLRALKALIDQAGSPTGGPEILDITPWQQRESSLKFMTRAVACMPDGLGFATSSIEGRVGVEWFDPEEQKRTYAFKCHRQTRAATDAEKEEGYADELDEVFPVNALAFHPVHGTFATGGGDGVVALWDARSKRRVRQYNRLGASISGVEFSADGRFLAMAMSPLNEDGGTEEAEEEEVDPSLVKLLVRVLGENEAKGRPAK